MNPRISVIVPVYNNAPFLAEALESVMAQGRQDMETLVVDDGSIDRSLEIAKSFPSVRCFSQPNSGPAAARNAGLRMARGSVYAFLDGDDAWVPGHLDLLLPLLDEGGYDMAYGQMQKVGPGLKRPDGTPDSIGCPVPEFGFGSALIRAEAFHQVGWINPNYRRGEDTEWCMRAREKGLRIRLTDQVVLYYRQHEANVTRDPRPIANLTLRIVKESLDRRRRGESRSSLTPVEVGPSLGKKAT